jgi:hypothetical protein
MPEKSIAEGGRRGHPAATGGERRRGVDPARTIAAETRMILWSSRCREALATTTRDGEMGWPPRVSHAWPAPPDEGFR